MTRTHATTIIALSLLGVVIGYLVEVAAAASGSAVFVPPVSLPITLLAIAAIVIILAIPIRRAVTGAVKTRIDPFRAMRIAVLAKSSSLAGAVLFGGGLGILFYLLTRSATPALSSIWLSIAMAVAAAIMLTAGLVAEFFCTLPPGDDSEEASHSRA